MNSFATQVIGRVRVSAQFHQETANIKLTGTSSQLKSCFFPLYFTFLVSNFWLLRNKFLIFFTRVRASMLAWWMVTRDCTNSVKPLRAAKWIGVRPHRDLLLTKALCSSRASQTSPWPFSQAKWRADIPSESNTSTRALKVLKMYW